MKNLLIWIAVILIAAGGIFMFAWRNNNSQISESISPTVSPSPTSSLTPIQSPQSLLKEFTLTASNFKFDVKEIKVKKGDRIKISLRSTEGMHDWVIDEFNARVRQIQAGQQDTAEFTADKAGRFQYYCSVGTHRQMGMWGTLIVE